MLVKPIIAVVVAVAISALPAFAQTGNDGAGKKPVAKPKAPVTWGAKGSSKAKDTRKTHMEGLFKRLAKPKSRDWKRAQSQIIRAWNHSGSPSMDLLARRADRAMKAKDWKTALVHLNDLVRLAPKFAEGWNKRATVYFLKGEYGPSLEDIARTLRLEPRHFGALAGLGIMLDRLGDKMGALEAYRRAVKIHPNLKGAKAGIKKLTREVEGERL